jgi:homoserine dehydrogenase
LIKAVQESLVANHIESMHGIINGTSNYILERMTESGLSFESALAEAQVKGYAESDPTLDVNGWDAAHKAVILASLSYGYWVRTSDIHVEGIENIDLIDIHYAETLGYVIKLMSVIRVDADGAVEVRTQPSLVPKRHILASVGGVHNAIAIKGDVVGEVLFYGPGAGMDATSSSVISDLIDAAHALRGGPRNSGFVPHGLYGRTLPIEETVSEFYLRIHVNDEPGVIAGVAGILAGNAIGIGAMSSLPPGEMPGGKFSEVILTTHEARYGVVQRALAEISELPYVTRPPVCLRIETL